jgi:hypothetical protein
VDDKWNGLNVYCVLHVGSGSESWVTTNDSETFWLGNWEFEVLGGICGTADKGGVSYNGSNE